MKDKRTHWTQEQYDLARTILNDPQWRKPSGSQMDWEKVFHTHPEWNIFGYSREDVKKFNSFMSRARAGHGPFGEKKPSVARPAQNGPAIRIGERGYGLTELEAILKEHNNKIQTVAFCPGCGLNLEMFNKAYSVALRHS